MKVFIVNNIIKNNKFYYKISYFEKNKESIDINEIVCLNDKK